MPMVARQRCVEPFGLSAGHPDTDAVFDLVNNNCLNTGCTDKFAAIIRACFDVADVGTGRDMLKSERVAVLYFNIRTPGDEFSNAETFSDQHVDFCPIFEFDECNRCIACRIMFDIDDSSGDFLCVITDVLQFSLVPVGWCSVCRASLAPALCCDTMSHVPHLHNAKPAEDFLGGFFVLKAHDCLLF